MGDINEAGVIAPERPALTRLTTGNGELDLILDGGFPANSIDILMGEPSSDKTILAARLMFTNAEDDGRHILFFTTLALGPARS